jgi:signal transduction histidine kinase
VSPLRGLALVALASAMAGLAFGAVYGGHAGLLMGSFLLGCGAPVAAAVHLLSRHRRSAGPLARQFARGVGVSVGLITLGVAMVGLLMFVSPHDALAMALLLLFAGALSVYSMRVLARGVMDDIEAVRAGLRAVGDGCRDVAVRTGGRDEVAELAAAANRMTAQLTERESEREAAESARRDLVAAVSHDLRTPLTSLRLLVEAVEDDLVDPEVRRCYLERMGLHVRSLSALIEDLFELSRLEAGDIQWSMRQVRLDELVEETVDAMRPEAAAKGVAVTTEVANGVAPARANPEKLQRVLFNLIQNAIRHTPADGSVTVAAESNGARVEVEVADTGHGMAPADRDRAFEPFFRAGHDASRPREGAGLGLAICRAIVEGHGGQIWFADSPQGTRVRFSLPRWVASRPAYRAKTTIRSRAL